MKTWKIPVTWTVYGEMVIDAETLDEALLMAEDADLPIESDYLDDSLIIPDIDDEMLLTINHPEDWDY